jgi:putative tryptophan/tyrosine transport system substrate-binding protein
VKRRDVITVLLGAAALARPALAQESRPGIARIGFIGNGPASEHRLRDAFGAGLRENGLVEGRDCTVVTSFAEGESDRLPALVQDLLRQKVDVIVLAGPSAIRAAESVTSTVPIVIAVAGDPVADGFVPGLAHPGGNLTGLSMNNTEISGKRLELLKETTPSMTRVAALVDASLVMAGLSEVEAAAHSLGLALQHSGHGPAIAPRARRRGDRISSLRPLIPSDVEGRLARPHPERRSAASRDAVGSG